MRRNRLRAASALLCLLLASSGCFGGFNLTRELHRKNSHVDGQWAREGVFFALLIVPVYEGVLLADLLVLNTIEFFSGRNPIQEGEDDDTTP
jgi:hypothetical protein